MIKKLSTALLLGGLSTAALAHVHTGNYFKSGFMVGVHGGYSYGHGKFNSVFNDGLGSSDLGGSSQARSNGGIYGIHGGYTHLMPNNYTLGGNLMFSLYSNNKLSTNVIHDFSGNGVKTRDIFNNNVKRNYSFIPSVNIGKVFMQRYHVYFGLGMAITRFEHEAVNIVEQRSAKTSKTKVGFVPSVGFDYALDNHFIIGTNFSYEIYQKLDNTFNAPDISELSKETYKSSINPRFFNARVGISYKF